MALKYFLAYKKYNQKMFIFFGDLKRPKGRVQKGTVGSL